MRPRRDVPSEREGGDDPVARLLALDVWPLVSLDFEASGLHRDSYPVEVGVSRWESPRDPIRTWSRVVRPADAWRATRWSARAQAMHGLSREDLEGGEPVDRVLAGVTRMTRGALPISDRGAVHDKRWMERLMRANGDDGVFYLTDTELINAAAGPTMSTWLHAHRSPHRAGPDARRTLVAFAYAFGLAPGFEDDMVRG